VGLSAEYLRRLTDGGKVKVRRMPSGHRVYSRRDLEAFQEERKKNPVRPGRPKKKAAKVSKKIETETKGSAKALARWARWLGGSLAR